MRLIIALLLGLASPGFAQVAGMNPGPDPRLPVPAAHPPWHALALIEAEGAGLCTGAMVAPTTEENVAELLESERASTSKDPVAVNAPPAN